MDVRKLLESLFNVRRCEWSDIFPFFRVSLSRVYPSVSSYISLYLFSLLKGGLLYLSGTPVALDPLCRLSCGIGEQSEVYR